MASTHSRRRALVVDGSSSFGGATTTLPGLVEALEAAGVEVALAASHRDGWERVGLDGRVHALPESFWASSGAPYAWRELRRAASLRKLIADLGIDVVIANNDPAVNASAYVAARGAHVPVVQLIRGGVRWSRLGSTMLGDAAAIFSHGGADEGRRAGFDDAFLGRWQRLDEGLPARTWPRPRDVDADGWLWASTLARWKGLPLFLRSLAAVEERPRVDVCYVPLAADHADADVVPTTIPRNVTLHEHPRGLDAIRARSRVYVHTSLVPEPFGRSILEAMAAGLCAIVPNEGGAARLIVHGVTGLVYEARSAESLTATLRLAATNPGLVDGCGAAAAAAAEAWRAERVLRPLIDTVTSVVAPSEGSLRALAS